MTPGAPDGVVGPVSIRVRTNGVICRIMCLLAGANCETLPDRRVKPRPVSNNEVLIRKRTSDFRGALTMVLDPYLLHVADRIIRMFKYYADLLDVTAVEFQRYLEERLPQEIRNAPKSVPYQTLYPTLKDLIDEFVQRKSKPSKKPALPGTR